MIGEKLSENISNFMDDVRETADYVGSLPYGQYDPWIKFSGAVGNALGDSSAQSYSHTLDDFNYQTGQVDQSTADRLRSLSYNLSHGMVSSAEKAVDRLGTMLSNSGTDTSSPSYYAAPEPLTAPVYQDAPLAELYGMDASTAYQEALSNTAMQRYVKDLQAAGLNPVLGIKSGGSDSFSGSALSAYSTSGSGSGSSSLKDNAAGIGKLLGAVAGLVGSVAGNSFVKKWGQYGHTEASSARAIGNSASNVLSSLGSLISNW